MSVLKNARKSGESVNMNAARGLVALSVALALGAGQQVSAAQKKEADSVYEWGRWAVLSPAAGGTEPYVAALEPDAINNARPQDADEFDPKVLSEPGAPVDVVEFCEAGSSCGYASYRRSEGGESSEAEPPAVLARFNLEAVEPAPTSDVTPTLLVGGGEGDPAAVRFDVTDSGDAAYPDIHSVDADNLSSGLYQGEAKDVLSSELLSDGISTLENQQLQQSELVDVGGYEGVDSGQWSDLGEQRLVAILTGDTDVPPEVVMGTTPLYDAGGHFVFGQTPTIEQMEAFTAGHVNAVYNGAVLDYGSAVQLNFDFGANTWNGTFSSGGGFNGFEINGGVKGVNFSASEGAREVVGSFFNGGFNASGGVRNGTQAGVFATKLQEMVP